MTAIERYPILFQLVVFLGIVTISILGGWIVVLIDRHKKKGAP